jgi:transposase
METGKQMVPKDPSSSPDPQVLPNPKLEKRTGRTFPAEYKLRIVQEANACKHGELGKLLRREKLYRNQLFLYQGGICPNIHR